MLKIRLASVFVCVCFLKSELIKFKFLKYLTKQLLFFGNLKKKRFNCVFIEWYDKKHYPPNIMNATIYNIIAKNKKIFFRKQIEEYGGT